MPMIEMTGINKTYSSNAVHACRDISISIQRNTIHMITGENGAGKSTIMKILSGDIAPDSGKIELDGRSVRFKDTFHALQSGIGMIHQILHFFPELSMREHFILGMHDLPNLRALRIEQLDAEISSTAERYGITCRLDEKVEHLSTEDRQLASLLALILRGTEIFILDEPPMKVLNTALQLKKEGKTIVIITHNMEDSLMYGDRISVLRAGRHIGTYSPEELDTETLAFEVMGEHTRRIRPHQLGSSVRENDAAVIEVRGISGGDASSQDFVRDISFSVYPGETLAVVGIKDNGLRALEALLSGHTGSRYHRWQGELLIEGEPVVSLDAQKVGYIPSDRLNTGSAVGMSVRDNLLIHLHRSEEVLKRLPGIGISFFSKDAVRDSCSRMLSTFRVNGRPADRLENLSGGNIQKLITSRALYSDPRILICADISWGLDIRTRARLFDHIEQHKQAGMAVLMFTSEVSAALDEADRIAVLKDHRISTIKENREGLTPQQIGRFML